MSNWIRTRHNLLSWIALGVGICLQLWVTVVGYRTLFNSDDAAFMVAAQLGQLEGTFLPPSWVFVNGDYWLQYTVLYRWLAIVAPLGWWAHVVVHLVQNTYFVITLWICARSFGLSPTANRFALALAMTGFSYPLFLNLWGASFYGTVMANLLLLALLARRIAGDSAERFGRLQMLRVLVFVLLLTLSFSTSPTRSVAYYVLPIAVAIAFSLVRRDPAFAPEGLPRLTLLSVLGVVIGSFGYLWLAKETTLLPSPRLRLRSLEQLVEGFSNAGTTLGISFGWLPGSDYVFGQVPPGLAWIGIVQLALFLMLAASVLSFRIRSGQTLESHAADYVWVIGLSLLVTVFGSLALIESIDAVVRYVTPGLALACILLVWSVLRTWARLGPWPRRTLTALTAVTVAQSLLSMGVIVDAGNGKNRHDSLVAALTAAELGSGFAPYWDASVTAALSNFRLSVAPVGISPDGVPHPRIWASDLSAFQEQPGEQYLIWPTTETLEPGRSGSLPPIDFSNPDWTGVKPSRVIEVDGFEIYVFASGELQKIAPWAQVLELIAKIDKPKG